MANDSSKNLIRPDAEVSDLELAHAFYKGNEAAAERLVERHGHALKAYLRGRSFEAEDVFQETWLRALSKIHRFKGGNFRAWLTVIARNNIIDRSRRQRPMVSLDAENEMGFTRVDNLHDSKPASPARLASEEAHKKILEKIQRLPAKQREVFLLRTQQELSFNEIAKMLKIPLNTALGRMHYAVTKLRSELEMSHENKT